MRIQHNIMAMSAYRNYNTNTSAVAKNLEKLSSGYKINRAGDDAAGLAISEKMRAQITGLNAAQKNVKDGISLVKTAEGAMQEIQDMLNRMDYLATQSANGTYDNEVDRAALQKEVNQLKEEINRIADSANFNGIKLLDGSLAADTSNTSVTELSGTANSDGVFSIVADGQLGVKPVAGVFTYDLSQLEVTINVDADGNVTVPAAAAANYGIATIANTSGATGSGTTGTTGGGGTTGTTGGGGTTGTTGGGGTTGTTGGGGTTGTTGGGTTGGTSGAGQLKLTIGGMDITLDIDKYLKKDANGDYIAGPVTLTGKDLAGQIATKLNEAIQAKYTGGTTTGGGTTGTTGGGGTTGTTGGGGTTGTTGGGSGSGASVINAGIATIADAGAADTITMNFLDGDGKLAGSEIEITLEGEATLKLTMKTPPTTWDHTQMDMTLRFSDGTNYNGGEQFAPTVVVEPVDSSTTRMYAQAKVDLNAMKVQDGSTLKIGDTTYTFAVGPNSKFKNGANVVDLTDTTAGNPDLASIAANRLTQVAKNNRQFIVGSADKGGVISLTEKEGAIDYAKNNLAGDDGKGTKGTNAGGHNPSTDTKFDSTLNDWAGLISYGTASEAKGGLTLQIGDTSDSFNQMSVTVGDMHTKGMGIANIDISTQAGASEAVQTIKDAINYVSSVRGDLGAVQNRLEHTANNLSVMAENIQDAESTIRDTDVAEEMMSYTKNNILVQSAQAMLAQANQVPQGVLQLLG